MAKITIAVQDAETLLMALQPLPAHIKGGALGGLLDSMKRVEAEIRSAALVAEDTGR